MRAAMLLPLSLLTLMLTIGWTGDLQAQSSPPADSPASTPTPSPSPAPSTGMTLKDSAGNWVAKFTGRVQGDYRYFTPVSALPDLFSVRRARIGLELTMYRDYLFYVEGEFATGNAQANTAQGASLTNAYLELTFFKWARPRFGQFKPPIGLENSAPDVLTDFLERGLTQNLLQNLNYDRGVMVHGTPAKGLYYGVSFTNGTGLNLEERNGSPQDAQANGKDLTARVALNFAPLVGWKDGLFHIGLGAKTGTVSNAPTQGSAGTSGFVAATGRTEALGATFFTPQAFNGVGGVTEATDIDRTLTVAELAVAWKPFKLQGEEWRARYEGTQIVPLATAFERDIEARYVALFWMITGEAYAATYGNNATFGRITPGKPVQRGDAGGLGAWEAGVRFSEFDASDFDPTNPPGTGVPGSTAPTTISTSQAQAWTAMVKWILNPNVRMLVNLIRTDFDTAVTTNGVTYDAEKAVTFRAQFDF